VPSLRSVFGGKAPPVRTREGVPMYRPTAPLRDFVSGFQILLAIATSDALDLAVEVRRRRPIERLWRCTEYENRRWWFPKERGRNHQSRTEDGWPRGPFPGTWVILKPRICQTVFGGIFRKAIAIHNVAPELDPI
jgi:hypothetical protein